MSSLLKMTLRVIASLLCIVRGYDSVVGVLPVVYGVSFWLWLLLTALMFAFETLVHNDSMSSFLEITSTSHYKPLHSVSTRTLLGTS